jgi:hypothetical protein
MLLECISRTFAHRFSIYTATTRKRCDALRRQVRFDLTVISEKLADGPGLSLLGQIARDSPDTRRVFCARRSRLQLLQGKLGSFGLFRTLAYPIVAQELLATLVLARAGLKVDSPVLELPRPARQSQTAAMVHSAPRVAESRPPAGMSSRILTVTCGHSPARVVAPKPPRASPRPEVFQRAVDGSARPNVLLIATMVGVFLMTLTLNARRIYPEVGSEDASPVETRQPDPSLVVRASPNVAPHLEARQAAVQGHVKPAVPRVLASTSPMADPSTFGSEAYEAIYPD